MESTASLLRNSRLSTGYNDWMGLWVGFLRKEAHSVLCVLRNYQRKLPVKLLSDDQKDGQQQTVMCSRNSTFFFHLAA